MPQHGAAPLVRRMLMELGMFPSGYQYYPLERAFADARRFG